MAVPRSAPNRQRNILIVGIVLGIILSLVVGALRPGSAVSKQDITELNDRLDNIEQKLTSPPPSPQASASGSPEPGLLTLTQLNKEPQEKVGQVVTVTGKVTNAYQGVGAIVSAADGTFVWVHTNSQLPSGTVTVKGTVNELKDQIATWKNEQGWPDDDSALTAKLRDEKIFIEAESIT